MSKVLLIVLTLIIVLGGGYLVFTTLLKAGQSDNNKPVTLNVWGIKEDETVIAKVIAGYKKLHPNVTINYISQTPLNYRTRVQSQVANNQGPDILAVHNTWTPMFLQGGTLAPAPAEIFSLDDYGRTFYKVVSESFVRGGKVYGIPSEIDGLALFYNEEILKAQNIAVPKTWDEVVQAAVKTTVTDSSGAIKTGGLGLGSTGNVDNWSEIIALLFLQQPNVTIERPNTPEGQEIISFFKNPAQSSPKKVWDASMVNTTQAFVDGKLTFYLGPSYRAKEIKVKNPNLKFSVMGVPQLPDKNVSMACFWGYGVSAKSKNQVAAWQFLHFLTDQATQKYIFEQESLTRGLGRPYPRVDLQSELVKDKILGAFVQQGPIYKSFYLCSDTGDNGLNDEMIKAFKVGIDSGDIPGLQNSIQTVLSKFTAPPPAK